MAKAIAANTCLHSQALDRPLEHSSVRSPVSSGLFSVTLNASSSQMAAAGSRGVFMQYLFEARRPRIDFPRDYGKGIRRAVQPLDPRTGMRCQPLDKGGTEAVRLSSPKAGLPPAPPRETAAWRRGAAT